MEYQEQINIGKTLMCLSRAQSILSPQVGRHQMQVAYLSYRLAEQLKLPAQGRKELCLAALVHDIGALSMKEKMDVIDGTAINIHTHAFRSARLVQDFAPLKKTADIIRYHHVPWAGGQGVRFCGKEVPAEAQLLHLADRVCSRLPASGNMLCKVPQMLEWIKKQGDAEFDPRYTAALEVLVKQEYIWFDLASDDPMDRLPGWLLPTIPLVAADVTKLAELFSHIIDFGSQFTARHSVGVASVAEYLAQQSGFSPEDCRRMKIAGYLHDLGKLAVDSTILEKNSALNAEEFNEIRAHTYYTYYLLDPIKELNEIKLWAAYHHERLDGGGYPFHITADFLPLGARIMAVADAFTAITEDRPYRSGMTPEKATEVLQNMVQKQALDEQVVRTLLPNFDEVNHLRAAAQKKAIRYYETFFHEECPCTPGQS